MPPAPKQAYDLLRPEHAICSKNKKDMTTNDNKRKLSAWLLAASLATALCGCSGEITDGNTLPEGKYPMTFTAQVDGLVATRATADNSWTGGEEIAIQIGSEVKKYTAATNNTLSAAKNVTPWYWQSTTETKTVSAWYPYSETKPADIELKVKANQSEGSNYQQSDYLKADETAMTFHNHPALTFKHRTAKVVVTLKTGEGVTDLTGAAVTFVNQTGVEGNGTEVIPKTGTAAGGGAATYTALVIPQQMQGKKFIKVTIGTEGAARDYYYTPAGSTNANLEGGKQYNYTIIVKKTGLEVESVTASWNDNSITPGTPTEATFQVHLPGSHGQTLSIDGATQVGSSDVYAINNHANTFSISYTVTDADQVKGFLIAKGLGEYALAISSSAGNRNLTYTFTYSNIRSDIRLDYAPFADYAQVGYYYYSNGVCIPDYINSTSPACIGIVFKIGAGEGDRAATYGDKLVDKKIHGYVAALNNAGSGSKPAWSTESVVTGVSTSQVDFDGYSNTQILSKRDNIQNTYPAVWSCINNNGTSAPASSSGWYMPSCAQIKTFRDVGDNIKTNLTTAGGSVLPRGDYWISNEVFGKEADDVWHFSVFYSNFYSDIAKTASDRCYVRSILTF